MYAVSGLDMVNLYPCTYRMQVYTQGNAVTCPAPAPANLSAQIGHQHSRAVFYVWPRTIAATASFHSP